MQSSCVGCRSRYFCSSNLKTSRTSEFLKVTSNHQLPTNVSVVGSVENFYSLPTCETFVRLVDHEQMTGLNHGY